MKNTLKCSVYLLARIILVCMLSFMALPLSSMYPPLFNPVLAILYTFMLIYFFVLTMWHEGGKDANRVEIGAMKPMPYKGYLSAFIVTIPLMINSFAMYAIGPEVRNAVVSVLRVVKVIFSFSTSYAITLFTSTTESDILEGAQTQASDALSAVIVFCVIYFAASVCAGIGYTFGYKKIEVLNPLKKQITDLFNK
ncbi:MAG: hypothetical protein J6B51_02170 [Clostridia bacterium]|nr:hypothetical protein [Clostridia bacterium]MBO5298870.1 hypothetical protein [Clostridia bacterium]MBQ4628138.1 hypothetical protein [Clostridia bacterium]